jgi:tetratricopeptide (TPR) repeat protein
MDELADRGPNGRPPDLKPNSYVETDDYAALRKYYEAMVSFSIPPTDETAALEKLEQAIGAKPEEALYRRLAAKMLLRRGSHETAREHLKNALECVQSASELAQTQLLLGFADDLLGARGEAVKRYQEASKIAESAGEDVISGVNRFVIADAKEYSQVPFMPKDTKKIEISFDITSKYDL